MQGNTATTQFQEYQGKEALHHLSLSPNPNRISSQTVQNNTIFWRSAVQLACTLRSHFQFEPIFSVQPQKCVKSSQKQTRGAIMALYGQLCNQLELICPTNSG